ncbi:metalloendopeptidase [Erysipelothrix piscisicarius]|uniref:Metalloendopeptidase n=1 Tax=Erysipelothrix piscisicarius TaxID=2485784 RepID=A0A3Q8S6W5_9FIRM|nr:peptidoglycan DD-metalloendopeptidase family protein [Erysipelothrix piscisicarius]AZK43798.1 metalloendopeptidase [Erysipelothrix piscisicarius]
MKKIIKNGLCIFLALFVLGGTLTPAISTTVFAASSDTTKEQEERRAQIEENKKKLSALEGSQKDIKANLTEEMKNLSGYKEQIASLDSKIKEIEGEIRVSEAQIVQLQKSIDERQAKIEETDVKVKSYMLNAQSATRVNGYFEFMMTGEDFSQIVRRFEVLSSIKRYNEELVRSIYKIKLELEADKKLQEVEREEIKLHKEDIELQKETAKIYEKHVEEIVKELQKQEAELQDELDEIQYVNAGHETQIKALAEQLAHELAQEQNNNSGSQGSNGGSTGGGSTGGGSTGGGSTSGFSLPLDPGVYRVGNSVWEYDWGSPHMGVDLEVYYGNNARSVGTGMVVATNSGCSEGNWACGGGYGNYISYLVHVNGQNYGILFAHLSAVYVSEGQIVHPGSVLGLTGNTGASTGPHLHVETINMGGGSIYDAWSLWAENSTMNFGTGSASSGGRRCDQGYGVPCRLHPQSTLGLY